jgi:hypothetical protein
LRELEYGETFRQVGVSLRDFDAAQRLAKSCRRSKPQTLLERVKLEQQFAVAVRYRAGGPSMR